MGGMKTANKNKMKKSMSGQKEKMESITRRNFGIRFFVVVILSLLISNLHFLTPTFYHHMHLIYDRLCYFPIILAAFWFGFWGGLITGMVMAGMHITHIWFQWGGHFFSHNLQQTLEVFVHVFLGIVTGILSERFLRTETKLRRSYEELRVKTNEILKAEDQLRRTERIQALAELSAGIAHEIRTPLSSIKGAVEILASASLKPEQRLEFSQIVLKETKHLNRVVSEFLNFARPRIHQLSPCHVTEIIDSVLDLTAQQRQKHEIRVIRHYESDLPTIIFDTSQLKQVFANLITNAIQAMTEGGTLTISCRTINSKEMECLIEDSGPGIREKDLLRLFDPFFTTRVNGTGLGLSIVQKILSHHHGTINVANRNEGGACFHIRFPVSEEDLV
ncbi:MAG: sensor histidine kinase [Candidatus Omnitrophota bacterium]|jgi:signal transduction histidine kinase|nr:MAG: sensor histidine kinase [Candidatus Omnitrophota bacterium]